MKYGESYISNTYIMLLNMFDIRILVTEIENYG